MKDKYRIAFFGSGPYALIVIKNLLNSDVNITFIVTKITSSEIIALGKEEEINVVIFNNKWKSINERLKQCHLAIVASFGSKVPKKTLKKTDFGFYNIHPSLLPRHRGPSPVVSEILAGDSLGGVTIYKMDNLIDHGPILCQKTIENKDYLSADEIYKSRFYLGSRLFIEKLSEIKSAKLKSQNHEQATYSKLLTKHDGFVDISRKYSAKRLYDMIRAYNPWPGVYFMWQDGNNKQYRIDIKEAALLQCKDIRADISDDLFVHKNKLLLTKSSQKPFYIEIITLRIAGKKIITAREFINGYLKNK